MTQKFRSLKLSGKKFYKRGNKLENEIKVGPHRPSHFVVVVMSDSGDPMGCSRQASLPMVFPRQENWSRLPFSSPRDLPNPGIKLASLLSPALAGGFFPTEPPGKPHLFDFPSLLFSYPVNYHLISNHKITFQGL